MGHATEIQTDPRVALARAAALEPDVFILDIGMPHMDGFELARQLRGMRWARPPRLIALTGSGSDADRKRAYEAGFDHHFVKPLNPGELAALLEGEGGSDPVGQPGDGA